jgi:hypothetical protein
VARILFAPFSIAAGILAGVLGKRLFELVWGRIDDDEPPAPSQHETNWGKVLAAAAIQGFLFALVRAATDRGARTAFYRFTGVWPGDEEPEPGE